MKKSFKLMSAALIALTSFVSAQADELTVYNDVQTSECTPFYGYNCDVANYKVQTIMPEEDLAAMNGGLISSMKFYIADAEGNKLNGEKLAVSLGTTEKTAYSGYMPDFITTGLTKVAEITMTTGETEVVVNFDEPWAYEGGNLVIETVVIANGSYKHVNFYGQSAPVNNVGYASSSFGGEINFYPKTTFTYEFLADNATVSAQEVAFGTVYLGEEATKTITLKNMGQNAFTPVIGTVEAPFSIEATPVELAHGEAMNIVVKFASEVAGDYNATLTINCGAAGNFNIPMTATAAEAPALVVVAEGDVVQGNVPVNAMNFDRENSGNVSQMIYTADLLTALAGKKINSITFQSQKPANKYMANGNLQLSIKAVEEDAFASANPYTDMTVIANASPVNGDIVFNFTEPYEYNGGNLAIEVLVTEKGEYGVEKFYGIEKAGASYAYFWDLGYETHVYNFLPTATFGYVKEDTPEPQGLRGDVNNNNEVTIADVSALIDYLLTNDPTGINVENADCNLQDGITIADVSKLIDYLLTGSWD